MTALLRSGFGTRSPVEATIVIAELFIIGFLIVRLAVHLFRYGSIQYLDKLSIAGTFRKKNVHAFSYVCHRRQSWRARTRR